MLVAKGKVLRHSRPEVARRSNTCCHDFRIGDAPSPCRSTGALGKVSLDRTGHILPENRNNIQSEIDLLHQNCLENKMYIDQKKSVSMLFNNAVSYDCMPKLNLNQYNSFRVVEEMKLVGFQLRPDLRAISKTNYIAQREHGTECEWLEG